MDEEHKQEFLHAVDARVNELEELLPLLMKDKLLAKGVSHLLSSQLTPHFTHPRSNERTWAWFAARRGAGRPCRCGTEWG